jgi:cytochrome c peroxidase
MKKRVRTDGQVSKVEYNTTLPTTTPDQGLAKKASASALANRRIVKPIRGVFGEKFSAKNGGANKDAVAARRAEYQRHLSTLNSSFVKFVSSQGKWGKEESSCRFIH